MLALNKKTGLLSIQSPRLWEVLYFHPRGVTLYYNPHALLDRALQTFVRVGRVQQAAVDEVRDHAGRNGLELWDSLLAGGYLTEEELVAQVRYEVEEEIYDLFFCRDGRFEFLEGKSELPERPGVVDQRFFFNTESVIMEAARRIDEWSYIAERIPGGLEVYRRVTRGPAPEDCGEEGAIVLDCIDGRRTVARVVEVSGLSNFVVFKMHSQLLDAGVIEPLAPEHLMKAGQACLKDGRPEDAISLFEKSIEIELGLPDAHAFAAAAYEQTGQHELSAYHLKCEAEFRIAAGDRRGGVQRLMVAVHKLPTDLAARERLVELALAHGDARVADLDAVEEGKTLVDLWMAAGDLQRVRGLLERLLTARPTDIELKKQLVNVHTKAGDQVRVVELYESIARTLVSEGRPIEAIGYLQKILMIDRSRRDVADQVRVLYARDERARKRRRSLATLGAFCLLVVALAVAYSVYDQAAVAEFEHLDVKDLVAADEFDEAAAVYDSFLLKYPLTTVSSKARAELLRIDGLRKQREAELESQRAATEVERQQLRSDYKAEWRRHRELFQAGRPEEALAVVENVRKMVARAGAQDDLAWALEEQVDKTCTMLKGFVQKAGELETKRAQALAAGKHDEAWTVAVELQKGYEITAAAKRARIPVRLDSRPQGARVKKNGQLLKVVEGGKERVVVTPTVLECGAADEAYTLERDGFLAAEIVVQAMKQPRFEVPLPVIPAHRIRFAEPVQTELGANGDWLVAGMRNGRLGIASAKKGKVVRVVELGGLREVEGAPVVAADRVWFTSNESTLECFRLDNGQAVEGFPVQLTSAPASQLVLRDGRILFVDRENAVQCHDQGSGRRLWSRPLEGVPVGPPVLERRIARVSLADGRVVRIDAIDGNVLGVLRTPCGASSRPFATEEIVVLGGSDGQVRAIDERNGKQVWAHAAGRIVGDAEIVVARTTVALLCDGDRIRLLDREKGTQVAEARIPGPLASMRLHGNVLLTVARRPREGKQGPRDLLQARDAGTLAILWEYEDEGVFPGGPCVDGTFVGVATGAEDVVLLR